MNKLNTTKLINSVTTTYLLYKVIDKAIKNLAFVKDSQSSDERVTTIFNDIKEQVASL